MNDERAQARQSIVEMLVSSGVTVAPGLAKGRRFTENGFALTDEQIEDALSVVLKRLAAQIAETTGEVMLGKVSVGVHRNTLGWHVNANVYAYTMELE